MAHKRNKDKSAMAAITALAPRYCICSVTFMRHQCDKISAITRQTSLNRCSAFGLNVILPPSSGLMSLRWVILHPIDLDRPCTVSHFAANNDNVVNSIHCISMMFILRMLAMLFRLCFAAFIYSLPIILYSSFWYNWIANFVYLSLMIVNKRVFTTIPI